MFKTKWFSKPASHSESLINSLDFHARQTELIIRESAKFSASGFVLTLLKTVTTGRASFGKMAKTFAKCEPSPMSRQALWQRIGTNSVAFMMLLTDLSNILYYTPYLSHITMETRGRQPLINTGIRCLS